MTEPEKELLSLLAKMALEAVALDLVRMVVNRPGVINGVEWRRWWKHPSWKELARLDKAVDALLDAHPELKAAFNAALDAPDPEPAGGVLA